MVVFGQSCCIRAKLVVIEQKLLYSSKSGSIRAKVFQFGQNGSNWAKLFYLCKNCSNRAKVVVFGQSDCIMAKWF